MLNLVQISMCSDGRFGDAASEANLLWLSSVVCVADSWRFSMQLSLQPASHLWLKPVVLIHVLLCYSSFALIFWLIWGNLQPQTKANNQHWDDFYQLMALIAFTVDFTALNQCRISFSAIIARALRGARDSTWLTLNDTRTLCLRPFRHYELTLVCVTDYSSPLKTRQKLSLGC